ncbi:ATP-dependent helicase [Helicobacter cynogastricus]|uniref:ATP-dependent helicase n=1 Tax=Helicobacter cynogastricus TaxID=329937 RepID=UPI000CF018A2|nr:UvrD-helicase domain-containing protein [Helicobacter cynogastricus]
MKELLLADLNVPQREACTHTKGPLLILAGAGSGKTKTLTTRLAYLIAHEGVPPQNTLTLTFTNKAAKEMQERARVLLRLCGHAHTQSPRLSTFHKFGFAFLKEYASLLEQKKFKLISPEEAKTLSKTAILNLRPSFINADVYLGHALKTISMIKNHQIALKDCYPDIQKAYALYQEILLKENKIDLDDLLAIPYALLDCLPDLAMHTSQRYRFIMVDEYQDTNPLQFKLLQKLCTAHQNLCVVGDDDQSIYGFRGADITNILEFQDQFPQTKVIKLEQNYRSSQEIVKCANALITHNTQRHHKRLFSHKPSHQDQRLICKHFDNSQEEGRFLAHTILERVKCGIAYHEMAILYRFNTLSKGVEESLRRAQIPYKIVGSVGFFERSIIKDLLAYLRVICDRCDDEKLLRIINKPPRGLGTHRIEKIIELSQEKGLCIYQLYRQGLLDVILDSRGRKGLKTLFDSLQKLQSYKGAGVLDALLQIFPIDSSCNEDELACIESLRIMLEDHFEDQEASLGEFLEQSILEEPRIKTADTLSCMSVHSAKGLEFRVVFVVGFEEGFFPYYKADLEEERRLCYVAITRAKEELYLCSATQRFYFNGLQQGLKPSSFLEEARLLIGKKRCVPSP